MDFSSCNAQNASFIMEIDDNEGNNGEEFGEVTDNHTEYKGFYEETFEASEKVDLASYFAEYSKLLPLTPGENKDPVFFHMGIDYDENEHSLIADYCSFKKLTVPGEMIQHTANGVTWAKDMCDSEDMPSDVELQTVKATKKRLQNKHELQRLKYTTETPILYEKDNDSNDPLAVPGQEIIVNIRVHIPISLKSTYKGRYHKYRVASVISILGSQTLADLRDKITCVSDFSVSKEISKDPTTSFTVMARDIYPSGFFYLDGTFYNDTRNPSINIDYSKVIRDWSAKHDHGPFKTASMEKTRIDSLSIKFGFPWVYQHQGRCEHIIVFSDARLCNADDELLISAYPRVIRIKPQSVHYCTTCGVFAARWITIENDRVPHNPCLLCNDCFKSLNYINGKKIGNFQAFAYPMNDKMSLICNNR